MPGGAEHEYTSPCFSMRAVITWRIELSHLPSHVDRAFTNSVDPKLSAEFSTHSRHGVERSSSPPLGANLNKPHHQRVSTHDQLEPHCRVAGRSSSRTLAFGSVCSKHNGFRFGLSGSCNQVSEICRSSRIQTNCPSYETRRWQLDTLCMHQRHAYTELFQCSRWRRTLA